MAEHWLGGDRAGVISIGSFDLGTCFMRTRHIHGGVCIYVRRGVNFVPLDWLLDLSTEKSCELCGIYLPKMNVVIICVYRSPDSDIGVFLDILTDALSAVLRGANNDAGLVLAGDFNIDLAVLSKPSRDLVNALGSFGMAHTVNGPTRIQGTAKTTIDNIFTNVKKYRTWTFVAGITDHLGINFCMNAAREPKGNQYIRTRLLSNANYAAFDSMVRSRSWADLRCVGSAVDKFELLHTELTRCADATFPMVKRSVSKSGTSKPSFELRQIKDTLTLMQEAYNRLGGDDLKQILKRYKEFYLQKTKEEKRINYRNAIHQASNIQRETWNIIRRETSSERIQRSPPVDALNDYFCGVAEDTLKRCNITMNAPGIYIGVPWNDETCFLTPVTAEEVKQIILRIKPRDCLDIYGMNTKMLRACSDSLAEPLADIINACFQQGIVPDSLKLAKVVPIFKSGDPSHPNNYRPISILPALSKPFEAALLDRIVSFLNKHDLLHHQQFGFRAGKNTVDAILSVLNYVWEAVEDGEDCKMIMCDLSKAFDCVQCDILLNKLERYGFRGQVLALLRSYMMNRKQAVCLNGMTSEMRDIRHGVAQGSLMGPILFSLYVNDLPGEVSGHVVLYADDTTLLCRGGSSGCLREQATRIQSEARTWFSANKLLVNEDKTTEMIFTCKRNSTSIDSGQAKLLGITLDTRLTWRAHIDGISGGLSSALYAIRRIRDIADKHTALTVYHAFFHARMSYGIQLWGESAHAIDVFVLQKRAVRAIELKDQRTSCRPLFIANSIMSLPCVYIYKQLLRAKMELPNLTRKGEVMQKHLRSERQVLIPTHRLVTSFAQHRHLDLLNRLPTHWIESPFPEFKKHLKSVLLEKCFYSISEYIQWTKNP